MKRGAEDDPYLLNEQYWKKQKAGPSTSQYTNAVGSGGGGGLVAETSSYSPNIGSQSSSEFKWKHFPEIIFACF